MRTLILAAAAAALLASPTLAATKKAAAPAAASNSMTAAPAAAKPETKGESKMSGCAKQWKAMGDTGHVKYNDMAKTMKSKKGGKMSGYNAWTAECMKKA